MDEFHRNKNSKDGRTWGCKVCDRRRAAEWRKNADRSKRMEQWQVERLRRRGLSAEAYDDMLQRQGGTCAICGQPETRLSVKGHVRRLAIDHDHEDGRVRGLLCAACNQAIGFMGDSPERLRAAAEYLTRRIYGPITTVGA